MSMMRLLRQSLLPLLLILAAPPAVILMWYTNVHLDGSLQQLFRLFATQGFFHTLYQVWSPVFWGTARAYQIIGIYAGVQLLLMRLIPGKTFAGPLTAKGRTPIYKANGIACYIITLLLFVCGAFVFHWFSPSIIYDNFGAILSALNIVSLIFCLFLYIKGSVKPSSPDFGKSGNFIFDYYWGTELYPRILGWDVKMFINCRMGMMSWPLIILSFAATQTTIYGLSNSMLIAVIIQLVYVSKFFCWETGYLCSLDIMHDRAGYYTEWGCLVWVPGIYTSPILYLVNHPNHLPWFIACLILIAGVASVLINYFADAQRQKVRTTQGQCKIWGKPPILIAATYTTENGTQKQSLLLASGWWGIARHFHYIPELTASFCWTVPALFTHALPYFYFVYLAILLLHRSRRDETRCQKKYGVYWDAYRNVVPGALLPRRQKTEDRGLNSDEVAQ